MLRTLEMHRSAGTPVGNRRNEQLWCAAQLPPGVGLVVIDVEMHGNGRVYLQSVVCPASLQGLAQFANTDAVIYHMHCMPATRLDGSGRDAPFEIDAVASGTLPNAEGGPVLLLRDLNGNWLFQGQPVNAKDIHELTLLMDVAPLNDRTPNGKA